MKVLYIIHVTSFIYGAGRSLKTWLSSVEHDFDIIIPKSLIKKNDNIDLELIRNALGIHLKKIYICWLPFSFCYVGASSNNFNARISNCITNILAYLFKYRILNIIKKEKYKYIHLNSLVLYPLIQENQNMYIHIREVLDKNMWFYNHVLNKVKRAKGAIFIDDATYTPFINCNKKFIILNNPFDMRYLYSVDEEKARRKYNIPKEKTVFSILGQLTEEKGVKFVIESFRKYADNNCVLLIVGECNKKVKYHKECIEKAFEDKRIYFIGEVKDPGIIYKLTDCVVRGDVQFAIGRTIYEGLYSGCQVLVPMDNDKDIQRLFELNRFSEKIFGYSTRDMRALGNGLRQICQVDNKLRQFYSNVDVYAKNMEEFLV